MIIENVIIENVIIEMLQDLAFFLRRKEVGLLKCDFHEDIKDMVQDHESRIRELEIKSAQVLEKMDAVCKDLQNVTAWIKTLIGFWLTSMVGFFIWYIQSLPR